MSTLPYFSQTDILMLLTFVMGYLFIIIDHVTKINKAGVSLLIAIACWVIAFSHGGIPGADQELVLWKHIADTSQVIFFLLGAMTIVEIVNIHNGFALITNFIRARSMSGLLWVVGLVAFFLSAVIDNLTATIVMIILLRQILPKGEDRLIFGGVIVIAANAGGAWTPIGDVTTTMLWIGGQISPFRIMQSLILPSLACFILPGLWFSSRYSGKAVATVKPPEALSPLSYWVFFLGMGLLLFVPVFKALTGLPPFMAVLLGLAILWIFTDIVYRNQRDADSTAKNISATLTRIDHPTLLFFLGILLAVNALEATHVLAKCQQYLNYLVSSPEWIAVVLGLISAVIDNVPLVAGTMGMFDLSQYPMDSTFWHLLAYCAGTGGSILIIGSAAGIAFMGMEKVNFFWYVRKISLPALIGYFAGIALFFLLQRL